MMVSLLHPKLYLKSKIRNKWWRTKSDCSYYDATCAIRLNQCCNAYFVSDYPTSTKSNQAFIEALLFWSRNYKPLQWFEGKWVNNYSDKFNFKKGTVSLIRKIKKKQPF
jgi:hypothetical protein